MSIKTRLSWLRRRAAAMPPAELVHRAAEASRAGADALAGPERHLRSLEALRPGPRWLPTSDALGELDVTPLATRARAILDEPLVLRGATWPKPRDSWFVDPESGHRWESDAPGHSTGFRGASGADVNVIWELHRLRHLQILALSHWLADDQRAGRAARDELAGWLRLPPFRGVQWASGIECAQRVVSLLILRDALGLEGSAIGKAVNRSLVAHGIWIERYPSKYTSANNHRIAELTGLVLLAGHGPRCEHTPRWRQAQEPLADLAEQLWWKDGGYAEQSTTYQARATEWLLVGRSAGAQGLDSVLARSASFLGTLFDPGGALPSIGDDDGSVVVDDGGHASHYVPSIVAATHAALKTPHPPAARWGLRSRLLGGERTPMAAPPQSAVFRETGLSVLHGTRSTVWFDHGPIGLPPLRSHGHADALAVWFCVDGHPILWDAGTYRYGPDLAWRTYLRSGAAHNAPAVDGFHPSAPVGGFAWRRTADASLETSDLEDGRLEGIQPGLPLLRRRVMATQTGLTLVDGVPGAGPHRLTAWFHFHPDVHAERRGRVVHLTVDSTKVHLTLPRQALHHLQRGGPAPGPGWASRAYGELEPAWTLYVATRGTEATYEFDWGP